jgi:flavin reductase (DIM6/NTAB) family NADH-FMN oxidoreductase RutF
MFHVPSGPQALLSRKALRRFPSGVTVVTIPDGTQARGMTGA